MTKKDFLIILGAVLLALAIGFSPYITLATLADGRAVKIRFEDVLIAVLLIISTVMFLLRGQKTLQKPPLFVWIGLWLGINFFVTLSDLIITNLYLTRSFFFFLKEVEFFCIYFYVFYHAKNVQAIWILLKTWMVIGLVNTGWIIFQILSGLHLTYFYGANSFIEPEGTIANGGFFLMIFLFLFNVFLQYYSDMPMPWQKKAGLLLVSILPIIGVFSSGSRGTLVGLIPALVITFGAYIIRKGFLKNIILISAIAVIVIGAFAAAVLSSSYLTRFFDVKSFEYEFNSGHSDSRVSIWRDQLERGLQEPLQLLWGYGTGVVLVYGESHNQYVRNIVEVGLIGSLIFLLLIGTILKKSWDGYKTNDPLAIGLSVALFSATVAMLGISMSTEPFIVVKLAEAYWFFAAITFTYLYLLKKDSIQTTV